MKPQAYKIRLTVALTNKLPLGGEYTCRAIDSQSHVLLVFL